MTTENSPNVPEEDKPEEGEQAQKVETEAKEEQAVSEEIAEEKGEEGGDTDKAECSAETIDAGECIADDKVSEAAEAQQDPDEKEREVISEDTEDSAKEAA